MRIEKVSYQKIYPTGMAYLNHKIGVEVQVGEGDDPEQAFNLAKETVDRWNTESNPGMAVAMEYMNGKEPETKVDPKELQIQGVAEAMKLCRTITALDRFKPMVDRENVEILSTTYNNRKKELQGL
jgi:hypothetical protein